MSGKKTGGIISSALMRENLGKNIYVIIIGSILYFAGCILPILLSHGEDRAYYLSELTGDMLLSVIWPLAFAIPLVSAVISFRAIHRKDMAMTVSSMPFSRAKVFCSNALAGGIASIAPTVVMALMMMAIGAGAEASLFWLFKNLCVVIYFFGLFVLAGVLTGSTVKHSLLCLVIPFVIPFILMSIEVFAETFLQGFVTMPEGFWQLAMILCPVFRFYDATLICSLICVAEAIVFLALALILMRRAKLERIGGSIMFRPFEYIFAGAITFIGLCLGGIILQAPAGYELGVGMIIGMILGGGLCFFIVMVIIRKSVKIFSKGSLIALVCAFAAGALLVAMTAGDMTGYAKRVPDPQKVENVTVSGIEELEVYTYYNVAGMDDVKTEGEYVYDTLEITSEDKDDSPEYYQLSGTLVTDQKAIEAVTNIHKYAGENIRPESEDGDLIYLQFDYKLKNGKHFLRNLPAQVKDGDLDKDLNTIRDSEGYRERTLLTRVLDVNDIVHADITVYRYDEDGKEDTENIVIKDSKDIERMMKALDSDKIRAENDDFDDMYISVTFWQNDKRGQNERAEAYVHRSDEKTLALIMELARAEGNSDIIEWLK